MTLPNPSADPLVRYVQGPEPGDRPALVEALATLLIGIRQRRLEGEVEGQDGEHEQGMEASRK